MLRQIKVTPLAAESLGVRSMCTFLETSGIKLLVDPGVSLAPSRFRLPPHPLEYKAIVKARNRIAEHAEKTDVIAISHYHFDHHTPSFEDWLCNWTDAEIAHQVYEDKIVLAKNPRVDVNASQRRRGWVFKKTGGKFAKKIELADDKTFKFGETELKFSAPVFHGVQDTPLGWVTMLTAECEGEKIVFASDVQGPMFTDTAAKILDDQPQLLIISGPPTYLEGIYVNEYQLQRGLHNLETLVKNIPVTIVEHHLLRDTQWREAAAQVFESAKAAGNNVLSAAEFLGKEESLLEARRKQLYADNPPSQEFKSWSKLSQSKQRKLKPPI